ncbi:MAG: VCBS repeat-containing protein, partial [Tannerella sp.]|nr:VCBS repeat-containing protein [Tannerella sp.]
MKRTIMLFAVITVFFPMAMRNVKAQTSMPGNITASTPIAWFTPENYNNGVWINRITTTGTVGNFTQPSGWSSKTPPATTISNFHPSVMFRPTDQEVTLNRMMSDNMIGITSNDAFTIILVYQRTKRDTWDYGHILNYCRDGGYSYQYNVTYYNSNSDVLFTCWPGTSLNGARRTLGAVPDNTMQLLTIDNNNGGTAASGTTVSDGIIWYLGGEKKGTATTSIGSSASTANGNDYKIVMGGSHYELTGNGARSFTGDIQELIILKRDRTTAPFMASTDLAKIHSYLAVKYGISQTANYVASNGTTVVWDITANNGYNEHIFGIARDDDYGLYQKQSQSVSFPLFTAFVGNDVTSLNSANTSGLLENGVYAMFGSNGNGLNSFIEITNPANQYTVPGSTKKVNYRRSLTYKTQITGATSLNIKFKPSNTNTDETPEFMLISMNPTFPVNATEVLPFRGSVIEKDLPNGSYISFGEAQPPPGNITASTPIAWFTPENYNNGVWTNRIITTGTVGNFTQPSSWSTKTPPATTISNFHPSVMFRPTAQTAAPHRLMSDNNIGITSSDAFTIIMVYQCTQRDSWDYGNILNYSSSGSHMYKYNVTYYSTNSNVLSTSWTISRKELGAVPSGAMQLLTIDNNNGGTVTSGSEISDGIIWYLGGEEKGKAATTIGGSTSTANNDDYKIMIGGSHTDLTGNGAYSFIGDIQELIILKRDRTTAPFMASTDLAKVHSYLAVKYGFSQTANYVASDGMTVVWDRTANNGYNEHIFGIARDDDYRLYQKQSQSVSLPLFTAFVGDDVTSLNSTNTSGRLENGVYAMFGGNGLNSFIEITNPADQYTVSGSTKKLNYRKSLTYKTQITGATSLKIKFKPSNNAVPEAMLISMNPTFPVDATEVLPFRGSVIEKDLPNGSYISFGGYMTSATQGPGGINSNLKLWLRADDETSLTTEILSSGSGKLQDYPDATNGTMVTAVSEWKDLVRGQTFSYQAGGTDAAHLEPVYQQSNYMTNFHPAIRFWGSGSSRATWLGNTSGVWSSQFPSNNKHSAFFVVNNDFGTHSWIYTMMFGDASSNANYKGPGYGVHKVSDGTIVGRFRTEGDNENAGSGTLNLFKPGATSILGYHHYAHGGTGITNIYDIKWRFNGLEDSKNNTLTNGQFGLNQASMIGKGYTHDRVLQGVMSEVIMYDDELPQASLQRIESYLAIKYGITLNPDNDLRKRFDYLFSNGTMLWNGTAGENTKWDTYYNRVAAVIRDDDANLHNRQSHSTNTGSIMHMGVAGTRLGTHVDVGFFNYDKEAVIWGDDNASGITAVSLPNDCGDFEQIFNRKWLVHKITEGNRPIRMLVGAENNSGNQLGQGASAEDIALFNILTEGYDVHMIIADDPAKLTYGDPLYGQFNAIVPMRYMDGEHQCAYTFTESETYITFGYKANRHGCMTEVEFDGAKTFDWAQWTRTNYGTSISSITKGTVDLGDGVQVTETKIVHDNGITVPSYSPSVTNTPASGSLYLQRRGGALNSKVTVTIKFNTPIRPEFTIYDIDGYSGYFEQVSVTGYCSGGAMLPDLSYAGDPTSSYYRITGNTATAFVKHDLSPTNKNGQLNVSFREGVSEIVITYAMTGKTTTSQINNLIISPIRIRQTPPPPVINEDGLSFVKDVAYREISSCEPVEYTFYIENVNCDPKYVNFRDTLPVKLKWEEGIGMDSINAKYNTHIHFNSYKGTNILQIDSLLIPGADVLRLTATAILDRDAVAEGSVVRFNNHAWIEYEQIVNDIPLERKLKSADRETLADETYFDATGMERQDTVWTDISTDKDAYIANREITVTITLDNPNAAITDSYLGILYNAGFTYIPGSFSSSITGASIPVTVTPLTDGVLPIAGINDGSAGFTIPNGEASFTFKLLAPSIANLVYEVDENGQPTEDIADLNIEYTFISDMAASCVILSMTEMWGAKRIPYKWLTAYDDYAATISGMPVKIPVCTNDSIPANCTPTFEVTADPTHGEATFVNDSILYEPDDTYSGLDMLTYRIVCDNDTSWANVSVYIAEKPDHIIMDPTCYSDSAYLRPATYTNGNCVARKNDAYDASNIGSSDSIHPFSLLMIGDIDSDGIVEIIGYKETPKDYIANDMESPGIKMFYFDIETKQTKLKKEFSFASTSGATVSTYGAMAIARYNNNGYIVVAGTDKHLYAYDVNGGRHWKSEEQYDTNSYGTLLGIADFNNDGTPEVYTGNQIFSLKTGKMLCDGSAISGCHSGTVYPTGGHSSTVADMDGDGTLEIIAGRNIYKVNITNDYGTSGNSIDTIPGLQLPASRLPQYAGDGATQVADIDNDGKLEVVVNTITDGNAVLFVWKPLPDNQSRILGSHSATGQISSRVGVPAIGNIDDTVYPEIIYTVNNTSSSSSPHYKLYALRYDPSISEDNKIERKWEDTSLHSYMDYYPDLYHASGITLFDFNHDGKNEILFSGRDGLHMYDGEGGRSSGSVNSGRHFLTRAYPIVADVDNDGIADIITIGKTGTLVSGESSNAGHIFLFKEMDKWRDYYPGTRVQIEDNRIWSSTRKVWNQYNYHAAHVNEDLTIPRYPVSPTTTFPGSDGILGTDDDVRPYNNTMHPVNLLKDKGTPLRALPDPAIVPSLSSAITSTNGVMVTTGIINLGKTTIGPYFTVAYYNESVSEESNLFWKEDVEALINPGDTIYVTTTIPTEALSSFSSPVVNIIARVNNDPNLLYRGSSSLSYPLYRDGGWIAWEDREKDECNYANNTFSMLNTRLSGAMAKDATLLITPSVSVSHNGTYSNPVSVLYGEKIKYKISVVNPVAGDVIIRDTLPAYLNYVPGSASPTNVIRASTIGNPPQDILIWGFTNIAAGGPVVVEFEATPASGANESQPLYINRAWITVDNTILIPTGNSTYHQGAGTCMVTFSTGHGGSIYNTEPQAIDYST